MLRWLFLVLFAPVWLPYRALRWAIFARGTLRTLKLQVRGSLPDLSEPAGLATRLAGRASGPDLLTVLHSLDAATKEATLQTVLVHLHDVNCGLARAEELRAALARVRAAGKKVIVYAETLDLTEYWIALGASQICLVPTGSLNVTGFNMEFTLLKGLLDKAGVRAQLLARGKYKSMAEMFTRSDISAENREMLESLVADLSLQLEAAVVNARGLSAAQVREALDHGPLRASQALNFGLVDRLAYADELREEHKQAGTLSLDKYKRRLKTRHILPRRGRRIAMLKVNGNIKSGSDKNSPLGRRATGSSSFTQSLRKVTESSAVAGVILRVDSPGGSALGSDVMWRALECAVRSLASQNKPIVISMGNLAASGGYYVCGLHGVEVWAAPTTLTGSIGVVAGKFEISGLLARLGVQRIQVKSGPRAGYGSPTLPWSEEELAKLAEDLDVAYRDFVQKMANARNMTFDELHALAQGRVWTGAQAHSHGLVDRVGGLYDVIVSVADRLGCATTELRFWAPEGRGGIGRFLARETDDQLFAQTAAVLGLGEHWADYEGLLNLGSERVLMLLPWLPRFPKP